MIYEHHIHTIIILKLLNMDIKEYLSKFKTPNYTQITSLNIVADLNKNDIDLQELYDKIKPSSQSIQFVSYVDKYKHIDELSKCNKARINRLIKSKNKKYKNKQFFKNCLTCKYDRNAIKIFKNGKIHITAYNDSDVIDKNVKALLSILNANMTDIRIAALTCSINIKSIDITNLDFDNEDVKITKTYGVPNCEMLKYKKDISCNVFPRRIIGFAKSHDAIEEFLDCIKDYVEFENGDEEIMIDDDFLEKLIIKICI